MKATKMLRVTKDGFGTLLIISIAAIVFTAGAVIGSSVGLGIIAGILWLFDVCSLFFFRDPVRNVSINNHTILAPADGTVKRIEKVHERDYMRGDAIQIVIYLSFLNVHINRTPVSGTLEYLRYKRGKFLAAFNEDAGLVNEHTALGFSSPNGKLLLKQIAGKFARRIVCHIREGHAVIQGEKFGMIKFGSRVDIFVQPHVAVKVSVGDTVRAGVTVLGLISDE